MDNWREALLFHGFIPPARFSWDSGQGVLAGIKAGRLVLGNRRLRNAQVDPQMNDASQADTFVCCVLARCIYTAKKPAQVSGQRNDTDA
jgi:hypothetical protein